VMSELKDHIRSTHLHDNQGDKDEHLWPGDGTIDWTATMAELKTAPQVEAGLLEIHYAIDDNVEAVAEKARKAFERLEI